MGSRRDMLDRSTIFFFITSKVSGDFKNIQITQLKTYNNVGNCMICMPNIIKYKGVIGNVKPTKQVNKKNCKKNIGCKK